MLLLLSGVFALCLLGFSAMHAVLLLSNKTTIESLEGARRIRRDDQSVRVARNVNIFDLGNKANWIQVMGNDPKLWFLPVASR
jgi:hypothetical protein